MGAATVTYYIKPEEPISLSTGQPPLPSNIPDDIPEIEIADSTKSLPGEIWGVIRSDISRDEHSEKLPETGATRPNRPVDALGRVSPQGKINVHIEHTTWAEWLLDLVGGEENFAQMVTPGDGYMDTIGFWIGYYFRALLKAIPGMKGIAKFVGFDLDDYNNLPLMCSPTSNQLVRIIGNIQQSGTRYEIIETLDFDSPPIKENGIWKYKGKTINPRNAPHLFYARIGRAFTNQITWLTRHGVNSKNDGGIQGGKGEEYRPAVSNIVAAQPGSLIRHYPPHGTEVRIYKESLVVDGELAPQIGGMDIIIGAYRFRWSDTYVQDWNTGKWYKADGMLVRADPQARAPGNGFDYRCYVSLLNADGTVKGSPWMDYLWYRVPRCGWVGLRDDFHLIDDTSWTG